MTDPLPTAVTNLNRAITAAEADIRTWLAPGTDPHHARDRDGRYILLDAYTAHADAAAALALCRLKALSPDPTPARERRAQIIENWCYIFLGAALGFAAAALYLGTATTPY